MDYSINIHPDCLKEAASVVESLKETADGLLFLRWPPNKGATTFIKELAHELPNATAVLLSTSPEVDPSYHTWIPSDQPLNKITSWITQVRNLGNGKPRTVLVEVCDSRVDIGQLYSAFPNAVVSNLERIQYEPSVH